MVNPFEESDHNSGQWSCVVDEAYLLSSAGPGSGDKQAVSRYCPPGEKRPHRHLDTNLLLLLLLMMMPMMRTTGACSALTITHKTTEKCSEDSAK